MKNNKYHLGGLVDIFNNYDAFFIDLWGVIHNGIQLNNGALNVLDKLHENKKRIVLMSNAPRPSTTVASFLTNLQLDKKYLNLIFTSGDAALKAIKLNLHGEKFFHLGPKRDEDLYEKFKNKKTNLIHSNYILCTGLFEDHHELEHYSNLLKNFSNKKMVCTNPDLVVHRGNKKEFCAGSVAKVFEKIGGKVIYYGKPYKEIYSYCLKKNEKTLVIGDNLNTDIKGANKMNLDSLFISSGVHREELSYQNFNNILKKYDVKINYLQENLRW